MDKVVYKILKDDSNITIKEFLKKSHVGRGKIEEIRVNKTAYINGNNVSLETILKEGDLLSFNFVEEIDFECEDKDIDIAYEDEYLLAVNKPVNLIIHPDDKSKIGTLVNRVAHYYKRHGINRKIRYIHRIDKESSGLVLFAKDFLSASILEDYLLNQNIERCYLALTSGHYDKEKGVIKAPIGEDRHQNNKMCVSNTGKEAITKYKVVKKLKEFELVEFSLITGRTHQIRVHSSYKNHPILGDITYGGNYEFIGRVALHSYKLGFVHPISKENIEIKADLLADMAKLVGNN